MLGGNSVKRKRMADKNVRPTTQGLVGNCDSKSDGAMPLPELLAPAGDWESLRAAVGNGADAVYFGLSNFNARHRATNFTLAELPEVMAYLHDRNVLGYVAFNTLVFS